MTSDTQEGVTQLLKGINMLDVLNFIGYAWNQVTETNIRNAWKRLFPLDADSPGSGDIDQLGGEHIINLVRALQDCSEATAKDAEDWLNSDAQDPGWKLWSEEDINKWRSA